MDRVTVIVPVSKAEAANHTHIALGKAKDLNTYSEPNYQDAQGNLYHVSSGLWTEVQIAGVKNPLIMGEIQLPENSKANLTKVAEAQSAFELFEPTGEDGEVWPKIGQKIVAVRTSNQHQLLDRLGMTPIAQEAQI